MVNVLLIAWLNTSIGANIRYQHVNGGGWVDDTATVASTAFVGCNATVMHNAIVRDSTIVRNSTTVRL